MQSTIQQIENPLVGILDLWTYKSCTAEICTDDKEKWATVYEIGSLQRNQGHAQGLLQEAKEYYQNLGFFFGGTVALNDTMRHIYKKLEIHEYV